MTQWYLVIAALLLLTFLTGLIRVAIGPTQSDRMLGAQLFGTTCVAIVLLITYATNDPSTIDVALIMAVLAAVAAIAFVRRARDPLDPER